MARIYLRAAKRSNALEVLAQHLVEHGHQVQFGPEENFDATVCWGISHPKGPKPMLNALVNKYNKFTCFQAFRAAQVRCPLTFELQQNNDDYNFANCELPWLARRVQHTRGKDIRVCRTQDSVRAAIAANKHDFFSIYIPTKTEYRAWVWRKRVLSVQEKVFKGPGEFKGFIRNHRFGFHFQKREELREDPRIVKPAVGAVKALEMDFGAVDLLEGKDGKMYVLEVNSMPAIDSPKRSSGIRLAAAISRWVEDRV